MAHNITNPNYIKYGYGKTLIEEGDVLLFRGTGWVSWFIQRAGESIYTHVGLASWHNGDKAHLGLLECVEFREWYGGRTTSLERYVAKHSGLIDVYRPVSPRIRYEFNTDDYKVEKKSTEFNGKAVTHMMRGMTGLPYGWRRIFYIASRKLPFLRAFYNISSSMEDNENGVDIYPVCSTVVDACFSAYDFDLTSNRGNEYVEPADLARSNSLSYLFTLSDD